MAALASDSVATDSLGADQNDWPHSLAGPAPTLPATDHAATSAISPQTIASKSLPTAATPSVQSGSTAAAPSDATAAPPMPATPKPAGSSKQYRMLRPERLIETAVQLERRIGERFPKSGLRSVAAEVQQVANEAYARTLTIRRPNYWMRSLVMILIATLLSLLGAIGMNVKFLTAAELFEFEHFVQSLEAALGSLVFLGAAIVFLVSIERRWKRERLLAAVRELRALAHVVDMHQLTKDPQSLTQQHRTASSPMRTMTTFELGRYLDYCSELLSVINKIGAVYVQEFPDAVALEAADQLATLTNDLSRNIWQKIMMLDRVDASLTDPPYATGVPMTMS
jgi:hypothetical protein